MNDTSRTKTWWRREPMDASGILRMKTAFLPKLKRSDRRKLPRPPLALNLLLLIVAVVLGGAATLHRRSLDRRFVALVQRTEAAPFEIKRIRRELADAELDETVLKRDLDARLKYVESQKARDFYIVLDTKRKRFSFRYGDEVVRDAAIEIGPASVAPGKSEKRWEFPPLTGAFSVKGKLEAASWKAPAWAYAMNRQTPPDPLPKIDNGLGRYVIELGNDYVIHSAPAPGSPLKGAKPGSFLVSEQDLSAIWRRVGPQTRVYIF